MSEGVAVVVALVGCSSYLLLCNKWQENLLTWSNQVCILHNFVRVQEGPSRASYLCAVWHQLQWFQRGLEDQPTITDSRLMLRVNWGEVGLPKGLCPLRFGPSRGDGWAFSHLGSCVPRGLGRSCKATYGSNLADPRKFLLPPSVGQASHRGWPRRKERVF